LGCQQQLREASLREVLLHELHELGAFVPASDPLFGVAQLDELFALFFSQLAVLHELVQLRERVGSFCGSDFSVLGLDQLRRRVEARDDFAEVLFERFDLVFFLRGFFFVEDSELLEDFGLLVELEELVVVSADPGSRAATPTSASRF
jgi:hypothetical protein